MYFLEWKGLFSTLTYIDEILNAVNLLAQAKYKENEDIAFKNTLSGLKRFNDIAIENLPEVDFNVFSDISFEKDFESNELIRIHISKLQLLDFSSELLNVGSWLGILSSFGAAVFAWIKLSSDVRHLSWYFATNPFISKKMLILIGCITGMCCTSYSMVHHSMFLSNRHLIFLFNGNRNYYFT